MLPCFHKKEVSCYCETRRGKENLLNIKPVLDVEMRAGVSIHEGLPSDFDPWKLIDLITLEVGVPKQ